MRFVPRQILIAGLLASAGFSAFAQTPAAPVAEQAQPAASDRKPPHRGERFDPAQRQQRIDQHFARLKTQLKITAQQEGAWTAFVAGTRPTVPGGPGAGERPRFDREEFAKLTTPQRIDKMREMRARHQAQAERRGDAVKTFYASLSADQQKTFDQLPMHHRGGPGWGGHGDHHRHGPHGGKPGDGPMRHHGEGRGALPAPPPVTAAPAPAAK